MAVADLDRVEVKIIGIEMVYIPQAAFYLGDPGGPDSLLNCFYTYPNNGAYLISSNKEIPVDAKEGYLYCDQDNVRARDAGRGNATKQHNVESTQQENRHIDKCREHAA